MKTNFENINKAYLAEILSASCTFCKGIRNSDECLSEHIDNGRCLREMNKWLNQEVNPMPELEKGDVIEVSGNNYKYVYLDDGVSVLIGADRPKLVRNIRGNCNIKSIKRYELSKDKYTCVWRADNGFYKTLL
ncbi:hypothetical protein SAMN02745671_01013 [Anaerovibrio lipolyticus DSM 3074]|uniref:Uncharacterized protein n=1 Tax=Anaerovibrio lipolyticus DSM 3074 TaxID=1120997 RepID=A0A1M6C5W9_9FIRM|nr:hypothetical protein [Anaerovibrio lipolyticus]SHI56323.1 hypothetical protein SAMN02745671_01013 [Anaerovibrio lipolyticus DSM 3074]